MLDDQGIWAPDGCCMLPWFCTYNETQCTYYARTTFNTLTCETWLKQHLLIHKFQLPSFNSTQNVPSIVACYPRHLPCWMTKAFGHLTVAACCPDSAQAMKHNTRAHIQGEIKSNLCDFYWYFSNACRFLQLPISQRPGVVFTNNLLMAVKRAGMLAMRSDEDANSKINRVTADARSNNHWQTPTWQSNAWWSSPPPCWCVLVAALPRWSAGRLPTHQSS